MIIIVKLLLLRVINYIIYNYCYDILVLYLYFICELLLISIIILHVLYYESFRRGRPRKRCSRDTSFSGKFLLLYYIRRCLIAIAMTISTILADRDDDVAEGGRTRQPDGREARKEGKLPLLALV